MICQIQTLHYRHIRGDMIETYKIITGKYHACVAPTLVIGSTHTHITRGNDLSNTPCSYNWKAVGPRVLCLAVITCGCKLCLLIDVSINLAHVLVIL